MCIVCIVCIGERVCSLCLCVSNLICIPTNFDLTPFLAIGYLAQSAPG